MESDPTMYMFGESQTYALHKSKVFYRVSHKELVSKLISLFYRYYCSRCSMDVSNSMPPSCSNRKAVRLANITHAFSVDINFKRTVKFSNSLISSTSCVWNQLLGHLFLSSNGLNKFKSNILVSEIISFCKLTHASVYYRQSLSKR